MSLRLPIIELPQSIFMRLCGEIASGLLFHAGTGPNVHPGQFTTTIVTISSRSPHYQPKKWDLSRFYARQAI